VAKSIRSEIMASGEKILEDAFTEVHGEVLPNRAIDPATIMALVMAAFQAIQSCLNAGAAKRQIQRGGAIVKTRLKKILKGKGYDKKDRREMADKLAARGTNLTEEEIDEILSDSQDVPADRPGKKPWWPLGVTGALILSFFPMTANAGWWPTVDVQPVTISDPEPLFMWPTTEPEVMQTRIILEISDKCGPCEFVLKNQIPILEKSGWTVGEGPENHVQIVNVTGTDHGPTPTWNLIHHGKEFAELAGSDHSAKEIGEWFNTFQKCGVVTSVPDTVETKTLAMPGVKIPSGGNWTYSGRDLFGHCVSHGYDGQKMRRLNLTRGQLVFLHSYAHNNPGRLYPLPASSSMTIKKSNASKPQRNQIARSGSYCPTCPR
jgi:hypothetical protein